MIAKLKTPSAIFLFLMFLSVKLTSSPVIADQKITDSLLEYFDGICQWIVDIDVGSGELKIEAKRKTSIFINSNLARILVAGYELTGRQEYLNEAMDWFDRLVALQQTIETSNGIVGGWWGDFRPEDNIYLGDAGTSATALCGIVRFVDEERKQKYTQALQQYANFVIYGSKTDPQGKNRQATDSFIIQSGEHKGAIGCGYFRNELSTAPYIISTAVTGAGFFSAFAELTGNGQYLNIAESATRWLLKQRDPYGEMPYMLHSFTLDEWPFDTMSYVADGIVGFYRRTSDEAVRKEIIQSMNRSIQWLLNQQNRQGTWGKLRSEDQQRSQGVLALLVWYYDQVSPHSMVYSAIEKNCNYFLDEKNSKKFGVKELPIPTGFVGLGIAEVLEPGITFRVR